MIFDLIWRDLLAKNGACQGKVVSDSMRPLMRTNDHVLVQSIQPGEERFGDIVVFERDGQLIIHRVIGRRLIGEQSYIIEKGDASLHSSLIPSYSILGRVLEIHKHYTSAVDIRRVNHSN